MAMLHDQSTTCECDTDSPSGPSAIVWPIRYSRKPSTMPMLGTANPLACLQPRAHSRAAHRSRMRTHAFTCRALDGAREQWPTQHASPTLRRSEGRAPCTRLHTIRDPKGADRELQIGSDRSGAPGRRPNNRAEPGRRPKNRAEPRRSGLTPLEARPLPRSREAAWGHHARG